MQNIYIKVLEQEPKGPYSKFDFRAWIKGKKWLPTRKLLMCSSGWHVTVPKFLYDWHVSSTYRVFVVQTDGAVDTDTLAYPYNYKKQDPKTAKKSVWETLRFLEEVKHRASETHDDYAARVARRVAFYTRLEEDC